MSAVDGAGTKRFLVGSLALAVTVFTVILGWRATLSVENQSNSDRDSATRPPAAATGPSLTASPAAPTSAITPTQHTYQEGRLLIGRTCPEGWCILTVDPLDGYSETLASFPAILGRPDWAPPWQVRRQHDPGFKRVAWASAGKLGWSDGAGNVVDVVSQIPVSEFEHHDIRFGSPSFDTSGNYWFASHDRTADLWTVYRVAAAETTPVATETSKLGVDMGFDGRMTAKDRQPFVHSRQFIATRADRSGCHEPSDVSTDGRCVGLTGSLGNPQHIAVLDPYQVSAARLDGGDRSSEMFAIRGRALTADTTLHLRHAVFSPDDRRVAFITSDRGADDRVRITDVAGEPRVVPGIAPGDQKDHLTLMDWLP